MQCSYPQGISVARRAFSIWMAPEHEFEILFLAFVEESSSLQRELATYTFPLSLYAAAAAQTESGLGTTQCIKRGQFAWHKHLLRSSSSSSSSNSYYESSVVSIVHHVLQTFKQVFLFRETQQTFTQATTTIIKCSLLLYNMCLHVHGQSCFVSCFFPHDMCFFSSLLIWGGGSSITNGHHHHSCAYECTPL